MLVRDNVTQRLWFGLVIVIRRIASEIFIFLRVENVFKISTNVKKTPMDALSFALTMTEVSRVNATAVTGWKVTRRLVKVSNQNNPKTDNQLVYHKLKDILQLASVFGTSQLNWLSAHDWCRRIVEG